MAKREEKKEKKEKKSTKPDGPLSPGPNSPATTIGFKMAKVLAEIQKIPKEGYNEHFGYKYVREDTLTEQIRPLLAKHGISLMFGAEVLPDPGEGRTRVLAKFTLTDVHGNQLESQVPGEGKDLHHQDKALPKALTGAVKYWLYKTFLVSTGDDQEMDGRETIDAHPDQMTQSQEDELLMYRKMEQKDPGLFTEQLVKLLSRSLNDANDRNARTASQGTAKRLIEESKKQLEASKEKAKEQARPDEEPPEEGGDLWTPTEGEEVPL